MFTSTSWNVGACLQHLTYIKWIVDKHLRWAQSPIGIFELRWVRQAPTFQLVLVNIIFFIRYINLLFDIMIIRYNGVLIYQLSIYCLCTKLNKSVVADLTILTRMLKMFKKILHFSWIL